MTSEEEPQRHDPPPSVVYTATICLGLLMTLIGMVVALLGAGGVMEFEGEAVGVQIKTSSAGLVIMTVGAVLAGTVAVMTPQHVGIFGSEKRSILEFLTARGAGPYLAGALAGAILLAASLIFG
ncbi:hypothetical protein U5640_21435 [Streptomyces sp. SS7]|uniref:hypothetical protein n=1 Tax=Streptomyces sp. SS7 TaxID=3108485 RepID=UPI0030EE5136